MSLANEYTLANDAAFVNRVSQSVIKAALAVMAEDDEEPSHEERAALARQVLADANTWGYKFARGVVTNGSISAAAPNGGAVPDGDIDFTVNSMWNAYAGVST